MEENYESINPEQETGKPKILERNFEDVMHSSMMPYSEHVILDRALPRVEDGLKPVQRRILYSMMELGVTPEKQHRKSARIVGDCMGKYHPHGDSSVYGAMVRMAQDFSMSVKLVDGHGNYGSVDGDPPAAMRYTEAKLMPVAMEMLRDLEKDTVKWNLNFDDTCKEPETLPGRFPNLLVNGATGIAVGLATNIPTHNLTEVIDGVCAYIDNPKINLDSMMEYIKAPDYPTGGVLVSDEGIRQMYETGKGKFIIRGKLAIEKDGDRSSIVITELPYQMIKSRFLARVYELKEKKVEPFTDIADVVDESDRNGIRAVIKLKKGANADKVLARIYKDTDLEQQVSANIMAIAEGRPQLLGLLDMIKYYVDYQRQIIYRRSQYDLAAAKEREHILRGILIAIENIDEVIRIIKTSASVSDSKANLRARFEISERQAQAILDIRLARLTKLEVTKVKQEIEELLKTIAYLSGVVASKTKQLAIVKKELQEIRQTYKVERRTELLRNGEVVKTAIIDLNKVEERKGVAVLTDNNVIKFLSNRSYSALRKDEVSMINADSALCSIRVDNTMPIIGFTDKGNTVHIDVNLLSDDKWRSKGTAIKKLIPVLESDEKVIAIFNKKDLEGKRLLFMTQLGMLKCSEAEEYKSDKKFYPAIKLKDSDRLINVEIKDDSKTIVAVSEGGICVNMESDVPIVGRNTQGVIGISLNEGDKAVFVGQADDEGELIVYTDSNYAKRVILCLLSLSKRNRKGVKIAELKGKYGTKVLFSGIVKEPYYLALKGSDGSLAGVYTEEIDIGNMASKGFLVKNIAENPVRIIRHCVPELNES